LPCAFLQDIQPGLEVDMVREGGRGMSHVCVPAMQAASSSHCACCLLFSVPEHQAHLHQGELQGCRQAEGQGGHHHRCVPGQAQQVCCQLACSCIARRIAPTHTTLCRLPAGGDSGIGRAVAVHFAREGADVAIVHLPDEQKDAEETAALVEKEGRKCLKFAGDVGKPEVRRQCRQHCA
jgi:hypothetical protein